MPKKLNKKNINKKNIKKAKKITLQEQIKKDIENFRLMDDEFFNACFKDNVKAVTHILRIIFNDENLEIIDLKVQEDFTNFQGHSVTLDIIARNKVTNTIYNIEIQRAKEGASPERARYHVDIYDTHNLKKNHDFKTLPTTYVIFITETDIFGDGLPIYEVERRFKHNNKPFNDRSYIIYVNGAYKGEDNIGKLVHDFQCKNPDEFYFEELAEKVRFFKRTKEGKMELSPILQKTYNKFYKEKEKRMKKRLEKQIKEKSISEGRAEGEKIGEKRGMSNAIISNIKSLMENLNLTAENAIKVLNIPSEEQNFYLTQLNAL